MPIDVDILEPPKKKSRLGEFASGLGETFSGIPALGRKTLEQIGIPATPLEQIGPGKIAVATLGALRGLVEAPMAVSDALLEKGLQGPIGTREVAGAVAPEQTKFLEEPSFKQAGKAVGEAAMFYGPPLLAKRLQARAPKPKMTTVANDLKALGKPEVREKLPIKEKTFEELATMREEVLRKVEDRRVETKPPEIERRVTERRVPEEQPPVEVARPAEMTPEQIRAFADRPEQIEAFAGSYGVKFDKYVPAKEYTSPKGKTVTDPPQYQFTDPQANNTTINITDLSELPAAVKHAREVNKPAQPVAPGGEIKPPIGEPTGAQVETARQITEGERGIPVAPAEKPPINIEPFDVAPEQKAQLETLVDQLRPEMEQRKGGPMTREEVAQKTKVVGVMDKTLGRERTVKLAAEAQNLGEHISAMLETGKVTPELVKALEDWGSFGTEIGRLLEARKASLKPKLYEGSLAEIEVNLIKKLRESGKTAEQVVAELKNIDFSDARQVAKVVQKNQTFWENTKWFIENFRYGNMLSSPLTHIVNTMTTAFQVYGLKPLTLAAKGQPRQAIQFVKEARRAMGDAAIEAGEILSGKRQIARPDVTHLPFPSKTLAVHHKITQGLEAADVFFRRQAEAAGEKALKMTPEQARDFATELIFRKPLDPKGKTGQGTLLNTMDKFAGVVEKARKLPTGKWNIPFMLTPYNLLKQGLEYSPVGFATMIGASDKAEQLGRALVGSGVFSTVAGLAFSDKIKLTWKPPSDKKLRDLFYAEGNLPFQVQIGDTRIQYSRIGPLAYPMAMVAAIKYYTDQDPSRFDKTTELRVTQMLMGTAEFLGSQLYLDQLQKLMDAVKGQEEGLTGLVSNYPRQLTPLSSFLGWLDRMMDTTYRKPGKDFNIESIVQNLQRQLPFLSEGVEPYTQPSPNPFAPDVTATRQHPYLNAVSPFAITTRRPEYTSPFQNRQRELEGRAKERAGKK